MAWREFFEHAHQAGGEALRSKVDNALMLGSAGAIAWAPFLSAFDEWMPRAMLLGGFILLGMRIWRQWNRRNDPLGK